MDTNQATPGYGARLRTVIECDVLIRGEGTALSPKRRVRQYFSDNGECLAEVDEVNERVLRLLDENDKRTKEFFVATNKIEELQVQLNLEMGSAAQLKTVQRDFAEMRKDYLKLQSRHKTLLLNRRKRLRKAR